MENNLKERLPEKKLYKGEPVLTSRDVSDIHGLPYNLLYKKIAKLKNSRGVYAIQNEDLKVHYIGRGRAMGNPNNPIYVFNLEAYQKIANAFGQDQSDSTRFVMENYYETTQANDLEINLPEIDSKSVLREPTRFHSLDILKELLEALNDLRAKISSLEEKEKESSSKISVLEDLLDGLLTESMEDILDPTVEDLSKQEVKYLEAKSKMYRAIDIAIELGIHSESGRPHVFLVNAIAKKLNIPVWKKESYSSEFIEIRVIEVNGVQNVYCVFTEKGREKITEWFKKNKSKIEYIEYAKKNSKFLRKGDVSRFGYEVGGKRYRCFY